MQEFRPFYLYRATIHGDVWSTYSRYSKRLKFHTDKGGYKSFYYQRRWLSVSRFVWCYFHGPILKGLEINHKNGIKADNSLKNLELLTRSQNQQHAYDTGLQKRKRPAITKLTWDKAYQIREEYKKLGTKQKILAKRYKVSQTVISDVVLYKIWKTI